VTLVDGAESAAGRTAGAQMRLVTKSRRFMVCLPTSVSQDETSGKPKVGYAAFEAL
jgi:hypothetical protein